MVEFHKAKDLVSVTLDSGIDDSQETIVLAAGQGATLGETTVPCWMMIDAEAIEVIDLTTDTITVKSGGRGALGTTPAAHTTASSLKLVVFSEYVTELQNRLNDLAAAFAISQGDTDKILLSGADPYTALNVLAADPEDMTVNVIPGTVIVSGIPYGITEIWNSDTDGGHTFTAPSVNPRIDVVEIDPQERTIRVLTGSEAASPSAPTVTTGCMGLCEILWATSDTEISDAMITQTGVFGT